MKKTSVFANYEKERYAFADLWRRDCRERILLLRGKSGSGKSTLLKTCHKQTPDSLHKIFINFKESSVNVADIFSRTEYHLGRDSLPQFRDCLLNFSPALARLDSNEIRGNRNLLSVTLNTGSPEEREERRVQLTDAWVEDVRAWERPLLISLDTYENTNTEVKNWLHGILARLPYTQPLRLAVAGQQVPDSDTGEDWADCCSEHDLCGIKQAKHWLPVVQALGYVFPPDVPDPLSYLACLCDVFNGHPKQIAEYIQAKFPHA